jgi:hypothetical protein
MSIRTGVRRDKPLQEGFYQAVFERRLSRAEAGKLRSNLEIGKG